MGVCGFLVSSSSFHLPCLVTDKRRNSLLYSVTSSNVYDILRKIFPDANCRHGSFYFRFRPPLFLHRFLFAFQPFLIYKLKSPLYERRLRENDNAD
uniref:Uncharacterized protein n=1 Tax=Octopus bimaculoides TaxID=37653 RepID=A0A0L8I2A0_OCTBM